MRLWIAALLLLVAAESEATTQNLAAASDLTQDYLQRYFEFFPSQATAAGRHDFDRQLEDFSPQRLREWVSFCRLSRSAVAAALSQGEVGPDDRLDLALLQAELERQLFALEKRQRPRRDPLFWSEVLSGATVFLLVRDDLPAAERLGSAAVRARLIPRLAEQAREALGDTPTHQISPELVTIAHRQIEASARFYREGFAQAASGQEASLRRDLEVAGREAFEALQQFGDWLHGLSAKVSGSPLLGDDYPENFRIVTGIQESIDGILNRAEIDLAHKVGETAGFGRRVWREVLPDTEPPADDVALVRMLFRRLSADRASSTEEFVADYRSLVERSVQFVRQRGMITLPEPLTLHLDRSPSFFVGQSVGGVYPAGPYAPEDAKTLLFLPTPSDSATPEQSASFFRDFNHHFNVMIIPHELIPGHYLQLKYAARHPRKIRAMFGDGVYIEGWGTFCERLMLDEGWGDALDRLAHLKKQMENIARTIVDIRVHTRAMSREEVLEFVQTRALQDEQFAANMWQRAITSSPQLTFYYLGYQQVHGLYEDVRRAEGARFDLRRFMDGMMTLGPVPVEEYRRLMLKDLSGASQVAPIHGPLLSSGP